MVQLEVQKSLWMPRQTSQQAAQGNRTSISSRSRCARSGFGVCILSPTRPLDSPALALGSCDIHLGHTRALPTQAICQISGDAPSSMSESGNLPMSDKISRPRYSHTVHPILSLAFPACLKTSARAIKPYASLGPDPMVLQRRLFDPSSAPLPSF